MITYILDIFKRNKMSDKEIEEFTIVVNQWVDALNNMRIADRAYHKAVALGQENHVELLASSVAAKVSFKFIHAKLDDSVDTLTSVYKRNYVAEVFKDVATKRAKMIGAE